MNEMDLSLGPILEGLAEQSELEKEFLPTVPKSLFDEYFAPLFKGEIEDPKVVKDLFQKWFVIARHPMSEVNVIDDYTGEVVHRLPSVFYTKMFDPTKSAGRNTWRDLVTMTQQINIGNPMRAEAYLKGDLTTKFEAMRIKGHVLTEEQSRWESILGLKKPSADAPKALTHDITDDDLIDD